MPLDGEALLRCVGWQGNFLTRELTPLDQGRVLVGDDVYNARIR
jgi:hypothetical protein